MINLKRKIMLLVPSLRGGGAERVMATLAANLDIEKFEIRLVLVNKEGPYLKMIPSDIPIIDLKCSRVRYAAPKLITEINNFKPEVILSTLGHLNLLLLGVRKSIKANTKIIVRHAIAPSASMRKYPLIKRRLWIRLYRYLYSKSDIVLAQCSEMKKDLSTVFSLDEEKIRYIYNPLDIEGIRKAMISNNPYNKNKINILAVGRLTYQKGFDILLDAFSIVNSRIPGCHLTILGDGMLKEELEEQACRLNIQDKISLVGFKDNPYPYYYYS